MPEDLPDDLDVEDPNDSNVVKALRRQARDAKAEARQLREQADRAAEAERRLAFAEAGVPLADAKAKYFVKGYDGEPDAAAIKAAWQEFAGGAPVVDTSAAADIAAADRISRASSGASVPEPPDAEAAYRSDLEAVRTWAEDNGIRDAMLMQQKALEVMRKHNRDVW